MAVTSDGPRSPFGFREIVRFRGDPLGFVADNARRYGDVVHFRLGGRRAYQINHPDLMRELLVSNAADHRRGPVMQRARAILGNGLLTSEEPLHGEQRRRLQPLFHRDRMAAYSRIVDDAVTAFVAGRRDGETLDVRAGMLRLSLDVIGQTLFGTTFAPAASRIEEAVNSFMLVMDAVFFPWPDLLLRLPLPAVRRFHRGLADLDRIIDAVLKTGDAERGGIVSCLRRPGDDEAARRLARDECVTFLLAGHETVANALTFAILLVAQHSAVADRIAQEAQASAALAPERRLEELRYTRTVMAEAMRLYPPVWILAREAKTASRIGAEEIAPGAIVFVSQWVIHRDPRFFPEPLAFRPERFADEAFARRAYFPFGVGTRQCIGEGVAWMAGTLALAEIVRRWRLVMISRANPDLVAAVTLRPKDPVTIQLTTRSIAPK